MRLFLIGWGDTIPETVDVVHRLRDHGHTIVYWTRSSEVFSVDESLFPGTIFHDLKDALAGNPASNLKDDHALHFPPPSAELIRAHADTEVTILTMMNKKYDWMEVEERKHFFYKLLGYWNKIIDKYQPEAIIFPAVPHTVYDYVIYALARQKKVKTIIFEATWVNDRIIILNEVVAGSKELSAALAATDPHTPCTIQTLPEDLQKFYQNQISSRDHATPQYMKNIFSAYSNFARFKIKCRSVWRGLRTFQFFRQFSIFFHNRLGSNMRKEYERVARSPQLEKSFIYAPLHFQPERTTCPEGGVFVDQLLMIKILSASVPVGWVIYVKEHPTEWLMRGVAYFSHRYRGFYEAIAALPNVQLVPMETNTYTLIAKAKAVATVTGTAGWEGIIRGKPALIFGYPWYQHCGGVYAVNSVESCHVALERIRADEHPEESDVLKYLYCLDKATFHGYLEDYGRQISTLSSKENMENIATVLIRHLASSS